jgi:NosR/NirI family nitrous oxide reductase transcriptional regulator
MATGFRPGLQVAVTVLHGQITAIEILENREDAPFLNRAVQSIVPEIIATQTLTVNVVSGATYSSRGVREAVADALTKAQL